MGLEAPDSELQPVGGRCPGDQVIGITAVQDEAGAGVEAGDIQVPRPLKPNFFADGEDDLNLWMGDSLFLKDPKDLADDRNAALVVRPQDRGAVAPDDILLHLGLDSFVGGDGVHVGTEQEGSCPPSSFGDTADQVADRSPDLPIRLVKAHLGSQADQLLLELHGGLPLLSGRAIDLHQRQEMFSHPVAMDHASPLESWRECSSGYYRGRKAAKRKSL